MSPDEVPDRDEVLRRLVSGELDPEREPARTLLAQRPELARELARLRSLEAGLAAAGRERARTLAEAARAPRTAAEDDAVARFSERAAREPVAARTARREGPRGGAEGLSLPRGGGGGGDAPDRRAAEVGGRPRARRHPLAAALVAAALVAAGVSVVVALRREQTQERPATLGPAAGCLTPSGEVAVWGTFSWDFALPPNGSFELSISDATAAGTGAHVLTVRDLGAPTWTWDPARDPPLPARIEWSVIVIDGSGVPDGRGCRARAWLR